MLEVNLIVDSQFCDLCHTTIRVRVILGFTSYGTIYRGSYLQYKTSEYIVVQVLNVPGIHTVQGVKFQFFQLTKSNKIQNSDDIDE